MEEAQQEAQRHIEKAERNTDHATKLFHENVRRMREIEDRLDEYERERAARQATQADMEKQMAVYLEAVMEARQVIGALGRRIDTLEAELTRVRSEPAEQ